MHAMQRKLHTILHLMRPSVIFAFHWKQRWLVYPARLLRYKLFGV